MTTPSLNPFEYATRHKLRYETPKGHLSVEQLWDLPLTHTNPSTVTLDSVARTVNQALKAVTEESFVQVQKGPQEEQLSRKLEVVKHIIAVKLAEREEAERARARAQEKARILEVLGEKEDEALKGLSREELLKRLAELG